MSYLSGYNESTWVTVDQTPIKYRFCVAVYVNNAGRSPTWDVDDTEHVFMRFSHLDCEYCNKLKCCKNGFDQVIEMFATLTKRYTCEYVLKLDDKSEYYKNIKNVNGGYMGFLMKADHLYASAAAGYLIKYSLAVKMANTCRNYENEENGVAACLRENFNITPEEMPGMYPDTPEQMLNYRLEAPADHVSKFRNDVNPITFHNMKTRRIDTHQIPKKIHIIWIGNYRNAPKEAIKSCQEIHPDWEVFIWTDERIKNEKFDSNNQEGFYTPRLCHPNKIPRGQMLCTTDLLCLEILYYYGGIYIDADSICRKSFNGLEIKDVDLFAARESDTRSHMIANGAIGASQYNPDMYSMLVHLNRLHIGVPWKTTGPCLMTQSLFNNHSRACPVNKIGFVGGKSVNPKVMSSKVFYPVHYSGVWGSGTKEEAIANAFTMQLWGSTHAILGF